ncbi:uncharacterized protein LOC129589453 isoform X2 [Paramacrobiotus metropolitanus]|uniref:uncharacterized protein LOC129589453 isoform X2 n=1 Tax=Paramacrobiotus metropolitanus TaxID=2943436 RepID=UPI002445B1C4|nr:uncharacterized protein LOC129589453 isoform X2 [Paramacrobiotus metropolitanus]
MEKSKTAGKSLGSSKKPKPTETNTARSSADSGRDLLPPEAPVPPPPPVDRVTPPPGAPSTLPERKTPVKLPRNLHVQFDEQATRIPVPWEDPVLSLVEEVAEVKALPERRALPTAERPAAIIRPKYPFRHAEMAAQRRAAYQQHAADFALSEEVFNATPSRESIVFEAEGNQAANSAQFEESSNEILETDADGDLYPPSPAHRPPGNAIEQRPDFAIFSQNFGEDPDDQPPPSIFQTTIAKKKAQVQNDPNQKLLLPPLPDPVVPPPVTFAKEVPVPKIPEPKAGSSLKITTTPEPKPNQKSAQPKATTVKTKAPPNAPSNARMSHKKDAPLNLTMETPVPVAEVPATVEKAEIQEPKAEVPVPKKFPPWERIFDFRAEDYRLPVAVAGSGYDGVPGPVGMRTQFVEELTSHRFFRRFFDELVEKWTLHTLGPGGAMTREEFGEKLKNHPETTVADLVALLKNAVRNKEVPPPATLFAGYGERIVRELREAYAINFPKYDRGTAHIFDPAAELPFEPCNNLAPPPSFLPKPDSPKHTTSAKRTGKTVLDPTVKIIRRLSHSCWPEELFPKTITKNPQRPRYLSPTAAWTTHIAAQKETQRSIRLRKKRPKTRDFVTFFSRNPVKPRPSFLQIFTAAHHRAIIRTARKSTRISEIRFNRQPRTRSCRKLQTPFAAEPFIDHRDDSCVPGVLSPKNPVWKHLRDEALQFYTAAAHPKDRMVETRSEPKVNQSEEKIVAPVEIALEPSVTVPSSVNLYTPGGSTGDNVFSIAVPEKRTKRAGSVGKRSPETGVKTNPVVRSGVSGYFKQEQGKSRSNSKYKLANLPKDFRWSLLKTNVGIDKLSEDTEETFEDLPDEKISFHEDRKSSDNETALTESSATKSNHSVNEIMEVAKVSATKSSEKNDEPILKGKPSIKQTIARNPKPKTKRRCYSLRNFVQPDAKNPVHPRLQRSLILCQIARSAATNLGLPRKHTGCGDTSATNVPKHSVLNQNFWKQKSPFVAVLHPKIPATPLKSFRPYLEQMERDPEMQLMENFSVVDGSALTVTPKTLNEVENEIRFNKASSFFPNDLVERCLKQLNIRPYAKKSCVNRGPINDLLYCDNKSLGLYFYTNQEKRLRNARHLIRRYTGEYRYNHLQRTHLKKQFHDATHDDKVPAPVEPKPEPAPRKTSVKRERSLDRSLGTTETEESVKSKKKPEKKDRIKTAAGEPGKDRRVPTELSSKPTEVQSIGFVSGKTAATDGERTEKVMNLTTARKNLIALPIGDEPPPWWKLSEHDYQNKNQEVKNQEIWKSVKSRLFAAMEQENDFGEALENFGFAKPGEQGEASTVRVSCLSERRDVGEAKDDYSSQLEFLKRRLEYYDSAVRYLRSMLPASDDEVINAKLKQLNLLPDASMSVHKLDAEDVDDDLEYLAETIDTLSLQASITDPHTADSLRTHLFLKILRLRLIAGHLKRQFLQTLDQKLNEENHQRLCRIADTLTNTQPAPPGFVVSQAEKRFIASPPASPVRHLSPLRPRQESVTVAAAEDSDSGKKTRNEKEKGKGKKKEEKKPPTSKGKKESAVQLQSSRVDLGSPKKKPAKA